jgi:hypothetical protein
MARDPRAARKMLEKVKSLSEFEDHAPKAQEKNYPKSKGERKKPSSKGSEDKSDVEEIELSFSNVEGGCHVCGA